MFNGPEVASSLLATFAVRGTAIPNDIPVGVAEIFAEDGAARARWRSFHNRNDLREEMAWFDAVRGVRAFVLPPLHGAGQSLPFGKTWPVCGPWQDSA